MVVSVHAINGLSNHGHLRPIDGGPSSQQVGRPADGRLRLINKGPSSRRVGSQGDGRLRLGDGWAVQVKGWPSNGRVGHQSDRRAVQVTSMPSSPRAGCLALSTIYVPHMVILQHI